MLTRQALAATTAVGRALRAPIDQRVVAVAARQRAAGISSASSLVDFLVDLGQRSHVTYLRRRAGWPDLAALLDAGTTPLVVVHGERAECEVLVLEVGRDGQVVALAIGADGEERPQRPFNREVLAARIGAGVVDVLLPMAIPPSVSPSAEAGDAAPAHVSPLARLLRLLGQERRLIGYVYLYAGLAGLFSLALPLGVQAIVGLVAGGLLVQPVVLLIAFVVLGTLANGGLQIVQLSVVETIQQRVFTRFAFEIGQRLPRLRLDAVGDVDLAELLNRFFEIKMIQKTMAKILTDWVAALLQVLFGVILLTFYHPYFSLFGLFLAVSLALIVRWTGPRGLETSLAESKYKYRVAHWMQELSRALTVFKFAGRGQLPVGRLDEEVTGYLTYRQAHFRVLVQQSWAFVLFKTLVTGGVLILGCVLVVGRAITLGQFVASELVIVAVLQAVEKAILGLADAYDLLTAVEKAGHVTDLPVERPAGLIPPPLATPAGLAVEARGLRFRYPGSGRAALADLSFTARQGERIAVTGVAGAGESTLLAVLGGLYESYEGVLTYDGLSLRELDRVRARELVAHADDGVALFEGSIEDNIALGRGWVRTEDVLEAAATAGLLAWLQEQPEGLRTPVASGGRGLPSQVARRVALARCFAGRPRLLLLDDVLDALDPSARRDVMARVFAPGAPWTVITVSHEPQVLAACDRVLVLRDGAIVADGTYETLRREDAYFRDLSLA